MEEYTTTQEVIVLYDDRCGMCSGLAERLRRAGAHERGIDFVGLSTERGKQLLRAHNLVVDPDDATIFVLDGNDVYTKSNAVLRIAKELKGFWRLLVALRLIPRTLRDWGYSVIGRHRYALGGTQNTEGGDGV